MLGFWLAGACGLRLVSAGLRIGLGRFSGLLISCDLEYCRASLICGSCDWFSEFVVVIVLWLLLLLWVLLVGWFCGLKGFGGFAGCHRLCVSVALLGGLDLLSS